MSPVGQAAPDLDETSFGQSPAAVTQPGGRPLSAPQFSAVVAAVTSAFGDPTRRQVYLYVREASGGVTATQVALRFGLHPNVARHHLDKLVAGGYLQVFSARAKRRSAGRPSKLYHATKPAVVLETVGREEGLLMALLQGALALLPPEQAEQMAENVGFAYGRNLASSLWPGESQRSLRSTVEAIAVALTAHGFAAHAELNGRELALVKDACPFFDAAVQHPVICAVDRGLVRGMLSPLYGDAVNPTESSSRALGDPACVTCMRSAPAG
ncbi:MAG: helix-turn-helix transcriptional regulator [Acidimicrobiales bacterium]